MLRLAAHRRFHHFAESSLGILELPLGCVHDVLVCNKSG
jgi:hypothetical protein